MKTLPILILLNLVAWGLVVLLLVGQRDLDARLAALEAKPSVVSEPAAVAPERSGGIARPVATRGDSEPDPSLGMTQAEMDLFRKRVRSARELNSQEDEVLRFVGAVNKLAEDGRIASLSPEQAERVAEMLIATDRAFPEIARRMRERHDMGEMTIEQRREALQSEYDRVRSDAQKALEGIVSPEDARVIVEDRHPIRRRRTGGR